MMQDKFGDYLKIYTTDSKRYVFVDCFYEESPEKLQYRVVLDKDKTAELISRLTKAMGEMK